MVQVITTKPRPPPAETRPLQELARDRTDLDIISVDEEAGLFLPEKRATDVVELTSSSDTEDSSDFRELDSEEDKLHTDSSVRLEPPVIQVRIKV